jgi:hypothetical protein
MARKQARFGQPAVYNSAAPTLTDGDDSALNVDGNGNLLSSNATLLAGEDLTNGVMKVEARASYTNISADTLIKTGSGRLFGFIVNSHTSGTLKVWDNTSAASTVILNTITFATGPQFILFPFAVEFLTGLYADVGGTIDITLFWK